MGHQRKSIEERFWPKVHKTETCWLWIAALNRGYGVLGSGGKYGHNIFAHRFAYELVHGTIPYRLEIDHLCRNTRCVNPHHLEAVSHRENILRGNIPTVIQRRKNECKHGHKLIPKNIYIVHYTNKRYPIQRCKECHRRHDANRLKKILSSPSRHRKYLEYHRNYHHFHRKHST